MGTALAAAILFLAACGAGAPAPDFNLLTSLGDVVTLISTAARDIQAVRLNDTRVHAFHSLGFLGRELLDTLTSALLRLPDLLRPYTYVSEMLPHLVAVGLVALTLLPFFVFPAKLVALFLAIISTYYPDWKVFDSSYLQNI